MRRAAARSQCANNLKQIALALHNYADTHPARPDSAVKDALLPAGTMPNANLPPERRLSWFVDLLPFVEKDDLFRKVDRKAAWDATANASVLKTAVKTFQCPVGGGREEAPTLDYLTSYFGVAGLGAGAATLPAGDRRVGAFGYDRRITLAGITDGTSQTMLALESARDNGPWAQGGPATVRGLDPGERPYLGPGRPFGGTHFGENTVFSKGKSQGCHAVIADGSVRFLLESVSAEVLEGLATIAGREDIGTDW